ncbi:WD40 repeat domain-containing protein [Sporomusa aerivorans]|uniref:WD40 repeat domain-containing protein n=1 Tax=Sporomusa aerivorans TaxID=204936 RepID=UPI00352AB9D5
MALRDDDNDFLRQLAWVYPSEYVAELKLLAEKVIREQQAAGERQNIREIVWGIMAKLQAEAEGASPELDEAAAMAAQAEKEAVRDKVLAALSAGQHLIPAGMGPEAVLPLAEAFDSADHGIAIAAQAALGRLNDGGAIDALCRLWAESRRPELEEILCNAGYLASRPLDLRLLTVLKTGADRFMLAESPELVQALLTAVDDGDRVIAGRARRMLLTLTDRQAIEAVCQLVLTGENKRLKNWAIIARYAPARDSRAALYYCITGQWDKYYALDWQETRPLLTQGYSEATPAERQLFLTAARHSGHSFLLAGLLLESRQCDEYEEITDADWEAMLDMLAGQERWAELYRLAYKAPAGWAAEIVLTLSSAGWQPKDWERPDWEQIVAACPKIVRGLFVPDGRHIVSLENPGFYADTMSMAFHPNGRIAAGGGSDGRLRLWQVASGSLWRTVDLHADSITAVAFTPDGRYLATAGKEGKVHIWQLPDIKWVSSVYGQTGLVTAMAAGNHGELLVAACAGGAAPVRVWAWNGADMTIQGQYPGSLFYTMAVNLQARSAVGGGRDGKLRSYALAGGHGGNRLWAAHNCPVEALVFDGPGRLLVSCGADGMLKIWQADNGMLLWSKKISGRLLAVSPDAALAAVQSDRDSIAIYQLRMTKPLAVATHADWRQTADAAMPADEPAARQAIAFLHSLLTAKFRYDIML